mgnify:FL=1
MIRKLKQSINSAVCRVVILAIPAMLLAGCEQQATGPQPPRLVNAMRIADTSGLTERSFPGRARAGQEVNRSFRVSGPLVAFPVSVGDEVKAGDPLARIDPRDFENEQATLQGQLEREQATAKRAPAGRAYRARISPRRRAEATTARPWACIARVTPSTPSFCVMSKTNVSALQPNWILCRFNPCSA